jgi:hypothetical protein
MSRYRTYGKLDDPYESEGDIFFTRMNNRLRPTQLQPGEVQLSQNGRMFQDGTWQPRKGLETLAGSITLDTNAIRLPYVIRRAKRAGGVVILTMMETPNLGFSEGGKITVEGLTGFTDTPNGTFTIKAISRVNKQISFDQTGSNESFTASSSSVAGPGEQIATTLSFTINDQGSSEILGGGLYSDPNSENIDDYVLTVGNNFCSAFRLRDRTEFKLDYPSSETITDRCQILQSFNKLLILRGKKTALECKPVLTSKSILSASQAGTVITVNVTAHGLNANDYVTIQGLENYTNDPNGSYSVATASTNSFTVTATTSAIWPGSFNASGSVIEYFNAFTLVPSGAYTVPSFITDLEASSDGKGQVTVNEPLHGLQKGTELTIILGSGNFESFANTNVRVSETSLNQFKFNLAVEETTSETIVLSHPQAIAYFIHQPAAPFGALNQRRLWLPYFYTSDANPVQSGNTDQIIASDILDSDTFDVIGNQFKITGGSSDFITAIEPFTENTLVVFGRRSVHRLNGVSGSLADVQVNVITPDIGCAARGSVAQVANKVIFLSDQGVYALEFKDEYNLRGLEIPLSESISPIIERINQSYIDKAVGAYFDNRYFLAVPLDGAIENSAVLVYNFITGGWESIDTVGSLQFNVMDMVVGREEAQNFLYLISSLGSIHKVDGFDGNDQVSVVTGDNEAETIAVESILTTREYDADTIERKFYNRAELHLKSSPFEDTDAVISFDSSDPDNTRTGITVNGLLGSDLALDEDASIRASVRMEGFGCSATIKPSKGRPKVRAVKLDARIINRKTTSLT